MGKVCSVLLGVLLILVGTFARGDTRISDEVLEREQQARYYINYAGYLIDVGKYLEALESYNSAEEVTTVPKTRIDALLGKASLLSSFLDAPEDAVKVYRDVQQNYPQGAEIAQYREGLLLFDMEDFKKAKSTLRNYLAAHPQGKFRYQTEALLNEIAKAPVTEETPAAIPPVADQRPEKAAATPSPAVTPGKTVAVQPDVPASEPPVPEDNTTRPDQSVTTPPPVVTPGKTVAVQTGEVTTPAVQPPTPQVSIPKPVMKTPPVERKSPVLRVRMCKTTGEAHIEGDRICVAGTGCRDRFTLSFKNGKILIDGSRAAEPVINFESENPVTIICGKKQKRVRGKLAAKIHKGALLVINIVDIEDYLLSVVPSENPASWPIESLKAQAVAARTYAYYQFLHREDWAYDLVDYAGDQAYGGMEKEHPRSTKAVKATAGEILTYDNKPILAMFSANSGGYTADSKSVFSLHKPYLVARKDPASLEGSMANWTRKYTLSEVVSALRKINIDADGLKRIEAEEVGPSGRIIKVRLIRSNGKSLVLRNRTTLRRALDLPEILHGIHRDGNDFIFEGHGWGHGVGYSQWGGAYLGKEKKYREILSFYYGSAKLETYW